MRLNPMRHSAIRFVLLGLLPVAFLTNAAELAPIKPKPGVMTVQAMAKMESQALAQVYQQAKREAKPAPPAPKLLAIHGVLPMLQAQLWIDGGLVLFQAGQTKPVAATTKGLRLRAIKPPCVSFDKRGQRHRLCLSKAGL